MNQHNSKLQRFDDIHWRWLLCTKKLFSLVLSKLFKWKKNSENNIWSISGTNISLSIVGIDFTKRLQRFDKSIAWLRYTSLALAVTPKECLKDIQNYLLKKKKNQVTLRNSFSFHSVFVLRQTRRTLHPCFTITWDIVTLSYFFFFFCC